MGWWSEGEQFPIASPTWAMLSPLPTSQASRAAAQPDQLERIWAKEERGALEPSPVFPCRPP